MIPITMSSIGKASKIYRISGRDSVRLRLAELGFVVGTNVCVISNLGDNVIIAIEDGRIALDKTLANKIFIG